jgi:hypothetical protein
MKSLIVAGANHTYWVKGNAFILLSEGKAPFYIVVRRYKATAVTNFFPHRYFWLRHGYDLTVHPPQLLSKLTAFPHHYLSSLLQILR